MKTLGVESAVSNIMPESPPSLSEGKYNLLLNNLVPVLRAIAKDTAYVREVVRALRGGGSITPSEFFEKVRNAYGENKVQVEGTGHIPPKGGFLLAANHNKTYNFTGPNPIWPFTELNHVVNDGGNREIRPIMFAPVDRFGKFDESNPNVRVMRSIGAIPVHPGKKDLNAESMNMAMQAVGSGDIVLIFPEGGRDKHSTSLQKAQRGVGWLALESGVPVVTMAFWEGVEGRRHLSFNSVHTDPKVYENMGPEDKPAVQAELSNVVISQIAHMLPEEYRGSYG